MAEAREHTMFDAPESPLNSISTPLPEHVVLKEQIAPINLLAQSIAQCPTCANIDFPGITTLSSKKGETSTMAFTCAWIGEYVPLPYEEREVYKLRNDKQSLSTMCPLGQFMHDAIKQLLYNAKCQQQMHVALNYSQYNNFGIGRKRTPTKEVDYRLSLFLEAPANPIVQRKLHWAIVQTQPLVSRIILDSTMDIPLPNDGYLDIAADMGSHASHSIPRNIRQHPLADQSLELINRWLSECTQNHTGCASIAEEPNLPTRVVDIGPEQEPTQPRLLVTNGLTGAYLALSHCWGHKPLFATRRSNIEQLKDGIPVKKLPQTFIDIFRVARILRIRYVWIDSLCIIQDDDKDWAREAQNMGLIYENSYCTIAATSSNSGSMSFLKHWDKDLGCFGSSQRREMYPQDYSGSYFLPLPYDRNNPDKGAFYITQCRQKTDPLLNISQAPLNTRGWVLQERLLSRRVLHFATDQIYWECRSHAVAQDGTVFRPRGAVDFLFPLPSLVRNVYGLRTDNPGSDEVFMRSWLHIIEFYSACSFTYEKDRLPALLGLADRFSRFTKREYVCGHWFELGSKVIPNTLLWTACGQIKGRLTKQVAPSWSWAAAEGELTFESVNVRIIPELLYLRRSDKFGIPNVVSLRIACELLTAYPDQGDEEGWSRVKQIWSIPSHKPKSAPTEQWPRSTFDPKDKPDPTFLGHITFDSITVIPKMVVCMYLFCDKTGYTRVMALERAKPIDGAFNVYQRVGVGSFRRGVNPVFSKEEIELT